MAIKFKTKEERDRYLASLHREPPVVPSPAVRTAPASSVRPGVGPGAHEGD